MKYLVEAGVIGVRRCKKEDLRRIAAATGGTLLPNLADLEGGETFDAAHLGRAEEVSEEKVGDGTWRWKALVVRLQCSNYRLTVTKKLQTSWRLVLLVFQKTSRLRKQVCANCETKRATYTSQLKRLEELRQMSSILMIWRHYANPRRKSPKIFQTLTLVLHKRLTA